MVLCKLASVGHAVYFSFLPLQVVRKAEWQTNQAKGQRAYTAARTGAAQPVGAGSRSWKGPSSSGAAAATAGGAAAAAAVMPSGVAES